MIPVLPAVVVIGGVSYAVTRPATAAPKITPPNPTSSGASPGKSVTAPAFKNQALVAKHNLIMGGARANVPISGPVALDPTMRSTNQPGIGSTNGQVDPNVQAALDAAAKKAQEAFDNMSDVEKQRAADTLNDQLKLDPPLNGHEDWKTINKIAETAIGTAAGAAVGAWIGGPIGAKIGALFGAYVGGEIADFVNQYASEAYDAVKDKVVDAANDVGDAASDAYNYAAGLNPF